MKCRYPMKIQGSRAVRPCGRCLPCRVSIRRVWTHRIMLEALQWEENAFVTLTFRDSELPNCGVSVGEHQAFMKELRARWFEETGRTLRFYMCGEYGDKTFRPHYHYALFNFPSCEGSGPTFFGRVYVPCQCKVCRFVTRVWKKGHVFIGRLELKSAQYIAGYVTKKMTKKDDVRLHREVLDEETGEVTHFYLNPEFSRSSRNPGIARFSVDVIVAACKEKGQDLPLALKHGSSYLPLGRYLRNKMYEVSGEKALSLAALETKQLRYVRDLVKASKESKESLPAKFLRSYFEDSAPHALVSAMEYIESQKCLQVEQRLKRRSIGHEI